MRLYPDVARRRRTALLSDLLTLGAVVLFAWLGLRVHDRVDRLAGLGDGVASAGGAVQGGLRSAGSAVGGVPLVGGDLQGALAKAANGTGGQAVTAGRASARDAHRLASLLGWLTFLLPAGLVLWRTVPARMNQIGRLTAASRALGGAQDPEHRRLIAARAAFSLPYATLLRFSRDPLGSYASGDYDPLVAAVFADVGLHPPSPAAEPVPPPSGS